MVRQGIEIWKPVVGYPDYEVSDLGRVKRVRDYRKYKAGIILKPCIGKNTYAHLTLCCNGIQRIESIHVLVLSAFVGPRPSPNCEVNHKNFVRTDNRLANLEWTTRKDNNRHAWAAGRKTSPAISHPECMLRGEDHPGAKLTWDQVAAIREAARNGTPNRILATNFNVSKSTIVRIKNRRLW